MRRPQNLIKVALVALAAVAAYYVFAFSVQVMPWLVAVAAAVSLVSTYIGLAYLDIAPQQRWQAVAVASVAMVIEAAYGVLYVLSLQSPEWFAAPLDWRLSVLLAVLHGGAFSVLAFSVTLVVVHGNRHDSATVQLQAEVAALQQVAADQAAELQEWRSALPLLEQRPHPAHPAPAPGATTNAKAVTIGGTTYPSMTAASKALGISRQALAKRLQKEEA